MVHHPVDADDFDLLVLESKSSWRLSDDGVSARHTLVCRGSTKPHKVRRLPKPRIAGVQTAKVVGPPGSEIDVDEQGRVQVEFHWDRRRIGAIGASRRIRVSQGWAGVGHGFVTLPRVGDEVVVAYLDGDADQPLVVGSVHNPTRPNPLKLPEDKTVSVWRTRSSPGGEGYNEIRLDDRAGAERFSTHAQRDFEAVVENDSSTVVRRNETRRVDGDFTSRTRGVGDMRFEEGFELSTPNQATISAKRVETRSGTSTTTTRGKSRAQAGEIEQSADGTMSLSGKCVTVKGDGSIELSVGASSIRITSGGITIKGPTITISATGLCDVKGAPIQLNC